jgi:hypothetical protein
MRENSEDEMMNDGMMNPALFLIRFWRSLHSSFQHSIIHH